MVERADPRATAEMAVEIVVAYLGNQTVEPARLPALIRDVMSALSGNAASADSADPRNAPEVSKLVSAPASHGEPPESAVDSSDYVVCLEDNLRFKSLKRHLKAKHNLSPDEYRKKWNLPDDYPMVSADYADVRSRLAREIGFRSKAPNQKASVGSVARR